METASFIDVRDVVRGVARRWLPILLFTVLCAVLSYFFVNSAKPVYTAEAQVLIQNQDNPYTRVGQDRGDASALTERDVTSQVEVLRSRDLALRVINDLQLTEAAEFDPLKSGIGMVGRLMIGFGFKADPRTMTVEQRVLAHYYKNITAYAVPQSHVVTVEFAASDPELAAKVANSIAAHYVSFTKKTLSEPTGRARDWLATQIEDLRKKVVQSETAVEKFRAEAGLYRGAQAKLNNEELSSLNAQIIIASAARSEAAAKAQSIRELLRTRGTVDTSADVLSSPLIQRLREQQVQLTRSKAELSTIYLDNHPRIIAVNQEIKDLNKQLRNEAFKVVERLEQDAKVAAAREQSLRDNLAKLKQQTSETGIDDVKLRELEREASANRSLLETFLVRYTDASTRQDVSSQPGLGSIISKAGLASSPSFPKKGPIMLLATAGGFMIALGLAFVIEIMSSAASMTAGARSTVRSQPDMPVADIPVTVETMQQPKHPFVVPVIPPTQTVATAATAPPPDAVISTQAQPAAAPAATAPATTVPAQAPVAPAVPTTPATSALATLPAMATSMLATHACGNGLSDPSNSYRKAMEPVAIKVSGMVSNQAIRRLAIVNMTGSVMDSLTMSMALGRMLAMAGGKVCLVDANTTTPGLEAFEPSLNGSGLFDIVAGRVSFSDVLKKDSLSHLQIMPSGSTGNLPANALTCTAMQNAIQALEQVYHLNLLHLGEAGEENVSLAAQAGAVLIVANKTKMKEAQDVCDALTAGYVHEAYTICIDAPAQQGSGLSNIAASL